jgi:phosphorylcholine metabolism protein LicD
MKLGNILENKTYYNISSHGDINRNKGLKKLRIKILQDVKEVFDNNYIEYILDQGTLLGAYRCNGIIPHYHDIDLAIYSKETFDKLSSILQNELPKEYNLKKKTYKYEVSLPGVGTVTQNNDEYSLVSLDIYWYKSCKRTISDVKQYGGDIVQYYYTFSDLGLIVQHESDIFPLKIVMFENIECSCPNNVERYLKTNYGYIESDCKFDKIIKKYIKR